ncbi:hypothetical protein GGX14DRAFT_557932 [Mycena pura]|uniref:Uncharacterized protein n=1 Tax=Mycena pura TaxID=153505 RepID=A0AAD7E1Z1_9AGAR|nr:hypothetical protein GGX14DRAFT_557932 [Mycena pura]
MFWAFRKLVPGMQELFRAPPPQSPPLPPSPTPISAPNIDRGPPPPIPPRPAHLQQQFNTPIVQPDTALNPRILLLPEPRAPDPYAHNVQRYPALFDRRDAQAPGYWQAKEYIFSWATCTGFNTEQEELWFGISRKACRDALAEFGKLKPHQKLSYSQRLPDIGTPLVNFDPQHPVISHFLAYTKGSADAMQVSQWTNSFGLVLYPELEEIVSGVVMRIFNRFGLQGLPEPEQKRRIFSVGFALLQMLAAQHELEEPLDLSGSFLAELISRRVVFAGGQNDAALMAMWKASTMASNCKPEQLEKKFAMFKRRHTTYIDLHPPAFLRLLAAQPPPRPPSSTPMSKAGDSRPIAQGPAQAAPAKAVISVKPRPLPKKSTLEPGKKGNDLVDRVSSAPERNRAAAPSQAPKRKRVRFDELDPESEDSLKPLSRKMLRKVNVETEVQHRKQPARRGGRATK